MTAETYKKEKERIYMKKMREKLEGELYIAQSRLRQWELSEGNFERMCELLGIVSEKDFLDLFPFDEELLEFYEDVF